MRGCFLKLSIVLCTTTVTTKMQSVLLPLLFVMSFVATPTSSVTPTECLQPMERGSCKALLIRYYYNVATSQCEEFMYGGCYGNTNNFETMAACQTFCQNTPTTKTIANVCSLAKDIGPCDALFPRYYFDTTAGQCQMFSWGGCKPNGNNFETLKDCQNTCAN